jgi:hypothetical protein
MIPDERTAAEPAAFAHAAISTNFEVYPTRKNLHITLHVLGSILNCSRLRVSFVLAHRAWAMRQICRRPARRADVMREPLRFPRESWPARSVLSRLFSAGYGGSAASAAGAPMR